MASFEVLRAGAAGASDSGSVEPAAAPARPAPAPRKASTSAAVTTASPGSAAADASVRTSSGRQRKLLAALAPWALPVALVAFWQVAAHVGWLSSRILPEPWQVLTAFWTLAESGELWAHLRTSLWRAAVGFGIGAGFGLLLGLLNGSSRRAETLLDTTLQMIRNIPALALIPLVILWFGIDETAKLFLLAVGVFFPVYLNTFHGIRSADQGLIEMARSYGLSGWALHRDVILPAALPSILVGVRFSLGLVWVLLIVAETISAQSGIGYMTMNAREFLQTDVVLVGILLYALLGKLADLAARALERTFLRWNPAYR